MLAMQMTGENLRSCAMYITYALEKARSEQKHVQIEGYSSSMSRSPNRSLGPENVSNSSYHRDKTDVELSTSQMASRILKLYADLVCLPGDTVNISKFAKTVTNKVRIARHEK